MSIRYCCRDCGATISLASSPHRQPACPQCDGPLIEQPASQKSGLILAVAVGGALFAIVVIVALGAVMWLFMRADAPVNAPPDPVVVAQIEEPPPLVRPFEKGPIKQVFDPKKEELNRKEPVFLDKVLLEKWPAMPRAIVIPPIMADNDVALPLASPVDHFVVAGGGRYLLLPAPMAKKLFIVDVCVAKMLYEIDWPADALLAATMNKFFALVPSSGQIQCYNLATAKLESTKPFPTQGTTAFVAGSSSAGPLLIRNERGARLYDANDYSELPIDPRTFGKFADPSGALPLLGGELTISANGQTLASRSAKPDRENAGTVRFEGGKMITARRNATGFYLQPDASGFVVCLGGQAPTSHIFSSNRLTGHTARSELTAEPSPNELWLPTPHGEFITQLTPLGDKTMLSIRAYHADRTIANAVLDHCPWPIAQARQRERLPARMCFIPQARVVAYLPPANNQLHFVPVNLEAGFDREKINNITILSTHPATYQAGTEFRYQLQTRSHLRVFLHKLEGGPPGMTINPETGLITWKVPADYKDPVRVTLLLRNGGGEIAVRDFTMTAER